MNGIEFFFLLPLMTIDILRTELINTETNITKLIHFPTLHLPQEKTQVMAKTLTRSVQYCCLMFSLKFVWEHQSINTQEDPYV